jgi:DNA adenine methylase
MLNRDKAQSLNPFLKWAGGKRWLPANYSHFLPTNFNRYIEPFLGGGAVFFHLTPKRAILGDSNRELIETYQALRGDWRKVVNFLKVHHRKHSTDYYYRIRATIPKTLAERAARFIYLNRTCWNGLYRVNLNGKFNVPIGTKTDVLYEDDNFAAIHRALRSAELRCSDFEYLVDEARSGDLVFVDPPYTVRHNHNAFVKYNEQLFSWWDQERLFYALKRARKRGAKIVATNAFHSSVKSLYRGHFELIRVSRLSSISSKADTRAKYDELLILA